MRLNWNRNFSTIDGDAAGRRYYQDGKFYDGAGEILAGALPTSAVQYANLPEATPANFGLIMPILDWGFPNALVQSNGAGSWVQLTIPRCTWGARLAASAWNRWRIHCYDLGADFFSNGADWYPVGGSVILASADFTDLNNLQLGLLAITNQTMAKIAGWKLTIPAGLFSGAGAKLIIASSCSRAASINSPGARFGAAFFDLDSTNLCGNISFGNNTNAGRLLLIVSRVNKTKVSPQWGLLGNNVAWGQVAQLTSFYSAINYDEETEQNLYLVGQVTATANDAIYAKNVIVTLNKAP